MPPAARPRRPAAAKPAAAKDQAAPGFGRVYTCLRVRPALNEDEGGVDNVALQCDRNQRLVWALGGPGGEEDAAPRQFAFDELLEQHQQQQDAFDAVGVPAVKAALAGGIGCVVCYGANGAGRRYSMQCERVGQEGILPKVNTMLFPGRSAAGPGMRMPAPGDHADERSAVQSKTRVEVAYLVLTKEQQVRDLLAGAGVALSTDPLSDPLQFATWQPAASAAEVSRLLARGDANKPAGMEHTAPSRGWHSLIAYRLTHESGAQGTLLLATLADADTVISDGVGGAPSALSASMEALGASFEAMAAGQKGRRDAKQEALHDLELEVLRKLRPQLEQVMWQEQGLQGLAARLQQAEWEARSYADKEAPLQMQMEQQREMHKQHMLSLKAERAQISTDLQRAMGAVKGSVQLEEARRKHEEDTEVIGSRLNALQVEVELAEAEVATHDQTSTKARVLLPGVARDLAALALSLTEAHQTHEAAAIFVHALSVLEGAFGESQPELDSFKAEVKRAVTAAAQEGMARAGDMSERGAAIGIAPLGLGAPMGKYDA